MKRAPVLEEEDYDIHVNENNDNEVVDNDKICLFVTPFWGYK